MSESKFDLAQRMAEAIATSECNYDSIHCSHCDGGPVETHEPDRVPQYLSVADDAEWRHERQAFEHEPGCPYVLAHEFLGKDLAPHRVAIA